MISLFIFISLCLAGLQAFAHDHRSDATPAHHSARAISIARDPADVPPPVGARAATTVKVDLIAREVTGELDPATGATYQYWTFNGKVPGPMIRVRQGDQVEVTLRNEASSHMVHSIDFHAAIGPGGGAALSQVLPGQEKTFTFEATTPGLFVYHCGTPMIADHIANGMYGLILVEPPGGLAPVEREYYVMQGEIYTVAPKGKSGLQGFSEAKLLQESPEYFVFNGAVDALTKKYPLHADTGDTVRIFFGNAGPNDSSSVHVVGEIFSREYVLGSLTSPPVNGVQTASVPPGAAAMLELKMAMAGQFNFMDHAMARMAKGLMGTIQVSGAQNASLMHSGRATSDTAQAEPGLGMTQADLAGASVTDEDSRLAGNSGPSENNRAGAMGDMASMDMRDHAPAIKLTRSPRATAAVPPANTTKALNGCLSLQSDGRVMLRLLNSSKTYRLEAQPQLFDANNHRIVHVTGYLGSVVAVEDPRVPSFVVDALDELAPDCSAKVTTADLRRLEARATAGQAEGVSTIGMTEMAFQRPSVVVNVGEEVVWKNTSSTIHNVVADPAKATVAGDVRLPAGARTFASPMLQPGQSYAYTFTVPGTYRYVCTLHESNGMKGTVIVKAPGTTNIASAKH